MDSLPAVLNAIALEEGGSLAGGLGVALGATLAAGLLLALLARFGIPVIVQFAGEDPGAAVVKRVRLALLGILLLTGPVVYLLHRALLGEWYGAGMVALYVMLDVFVLTELALLALAGLLGRGGTKFPALFRDILRIVLYVAAFMVVLRSVFGVGDLGALLGASAVFSIIIGLAVQDTLGSVFAGLFLELDRPFRVGDWVNVGGREGKVAEINWRSTRLITRNNDSVSIPNSAMSKGEIVNFSAPTPMHRVDKQVAVGFAAQPNKVKKILIETMSGVKGVLRNPAPQVALENYGDAVEYSLSFWINDFVHFHRISEEVMTTIWYQFRRHGIRFAKDVGHVAADPKAAAAAAELQQALRRVDFLAPVNDPDLAVLAADVTHDLYAQGERVFAQGEPGQTFYLIRSGRVGVRVKDAAGVEVEVAELDRGDYFGEMSLLTGEPRKATVVAKEDTELLELDRPSFALLLKNNPALGSAMMEVVKQRQTDLEAKAKNASERAARSAPASAGEGPRSFARRLLGGLRGLFGLGGRGTPAETEEVGSSRG